jgi:site-specific DNA-cytosine methylase
LGAGRECPIEERWLDRDGKATTITSSYHHVSNHTTKYVQVSSSEEEMDQEEQGQGQQQGSKGEGEAAAGAAARFLTPRECARLMGFPETFPTPSAVR